MGGGTAQFVQNVLENRGSIRKDVNTNFLAPRTMAIRHTDSRSKDGLVTDRHLVQFAATCADSTTGSPVVALINTTFQVPRHEKVTNDLIYSLLAHHWDFMSLNWGASFGVDPSVYSGSSDEARGVAMPTYTGFTQNSTLGRILNGEY